MKNKIKEAYIKYIELNHSSRSSEPANIMHDAIKIMLEEILDPKDKFEIRTQNYNKEFVFKSKLYKKKIDITIVDPDWTNRTKGIPIIAISFKMPLSSVNKNLKNYFELNIGDTTLVKQNGTPFYFFMILDENSIKFDSNKYNLEGISDTSIEPFSKIISAKYYENFRPNFTFITKVDFGDLSFKQKNKYKTKNEIIKLKDEQISLINNYKPKFKVYHAKNKWLDLFDETLNDFKKSIKLEIEQYKLRKKLIK